MMKLLTLLTTLFLVCTSQAEEYKSSEAILKDFKKYTLVDSEKGEEHLADMVVKVNDAVQFSLKSKPSQELLAEILRVSNLTLKKDATAAVAEVLVPLFKKDQKAFKKALKTLPKAEADSLLKSVQEALKEEKSGNG